MYVITGATGNTGRVIAEALLKAGKKVRVMGRDADKLKSLVTLGAEAVVGSLEDARFLVTAFTGAKAVYLLIPPSYQTPDLGAHQDQVGDAEVKALREARVPYVVHLSSMGAHTPIGTGPVAGLFRQERRLNRLPDTHVLHLRPSYFMENAMNNLGMIKSMGINGGPLKADLSMNYIATRDIANYATKRLLALDFTGKDVQELIGAKDNTPQELTTALGLAIGKPDLKWIQFPDEDAFKAMVGMGLSASLAQSFIDLSHFLNAGGGKVIPRDQENTTPTTIDQFAKEVFAPAYNAAG